MFFLPLLVKTTGCTNPFFFVHSHERIHILLPFATGPITTLGYVALPPAARFPAGSDDGDRHANIAASLNTETWKRKFKRVG